MGDAFEGGVERFAEYLANMGYEYHADGLFRPVAGEDAGEPEYTRDQIVGASQFSDAVVNEYCHRLRKENGWD